MSAPSTPNAQESQATEVPQVAILVDTATGWGRRVVRGILRYVAEAGPWHVWVRAAGRDEQGGLPAGWNGDGVIARVSDDDVAKQLTDAGFPVVNVSGVELDGFSSPCVATDNDASARIGVEHFTDRGLRNFGYVGPTYESFVNSHHDAFEKALADQGLTCSTYAMPDEISEKDLLALRRELRKWVRELPKPIGILTWGAAIGRDVIDACLWEKIAVPHDVAVLGGDYDDLLSEACYPALSGVLTAADQIGYTAAQKLHQMIQGKNVPHDTTLLPPSGVEERLSSDMVAVDDPKLAEVLEYLRVHAFEQITVEDVLAAVPMSRRILERKFKQAFGRSPLAEIRRIRINRARKLLAETDMQMQEVAEGCGYTTYNYLTHVFKQVTGMTPTDYRKQTRINH